MPHGAHRQRWPRPPRGSEERRVGARYPLTFSMSVMPYIDSDCRVHTAGLVVAPSAVAAKATAGPATLGHISLESAHAARGYLCARHL